MDSILRAVCITNIDEQTWHEDPDGVIADHQGIEAFKL